MIRDMWCVLAMPPLPPVIRDSKERGRKLETILHQYTELVKPAFEEFTLPVCKGEGVERVCEGRGEEGM